MRFADHPSRRVSRLPRQLSTLVLLATIAVSFPGNANAQLDRDRLFDAIDVIEVEVPIQVTLKGQPVADLTADRFRILDQGKERAIVHFEIRKHETTRPAASSAPSAPGSPQPQTENTSPRNFLLVFDATTQDPRRIDLWAEALRERMVAERDRYAVIVKGSHGFAVVTPLSSRSAINEAGIEFVEALFARDPSAMATLTGAITDLLEDDPSGLALLRSRHGILTVGEGLLSRRPDGNLGVGLADGTGYEDGFGPARTLIKNVTADKVTDLAESLHEMATLFGQPYGDRHVLLVSAGPNAQALITEAKTDDANAGAVVRRVAQEMFREFHRLGWRIHGLPLGVGFNPGLFYFAEETGGRVYENYNQPEDLLTTVAVETSVTYVATFQVPAEDLDERWHQLKIKISDLPRRARITHRPAYFAASRFTAASPERNVPQFRLDAETTTLD